MLNPHASKVKAAKGVGVKTIEELEQDLAECRNRATRCAGLLEVAKINMDYARSEHLKAYETLLEMYQINLQRKRVRGT